MWYQDILNDPLMQIMVFILALAIGWLLIRFIFKLAKRVFMIGCVAILLLGAILFMLGYIQV
jgi:hypothetical protein